MVRRRTRPRDQLQILAIRRTCSSCRRYRLITSLSPDPLLAFSCKVLLFFQNQPGGKLNCRYTCRFCTMITIASRGFIQVSCDKPGLHLIRQPKFGEGRACLHAAKRHQPLWSCAHVCMRPLDLSFNYRLLILSTKANRFLLLQVPVGPLGIVHASGSSQQENQLQNLRVFATTPIFKYWIQG